jgi:hypothetical protein
MELKHHLKSSMIKVTAAVSLWRERMITVTYDDSDGTIRTVTYGRTSREDMEDYLYRLTAFIERARLEWGRVWHLVDASQLEIQSDENLKCLAGASVEIQGEDDKTAVVMTSTPAIKQMERMPSQLGTIVFGDFTSARAWLGAPSGDIQYLDSAGSEVIDIFETA